MRRLIGGLSILCLVTSMVLAQDEEPETPVAETPPPQMAVMAGHVLHKDGVTPVSGAELVLTIEGDEVQFKTTTGRGGRYKIELPVGTYTLRIVQGHDFYTSPSVYRVSEGVRNEIDFLIIADFEKPPPSNEANLSVKHGPDPAPAGPIEVGTIVDVVHEHTGGRWRRWAETLGFIGSLLLVSLAAS